MAEFAAEAAPAAAVAAVAALLAAEAAEEAVDAVSDEVDGVTTTAGVAGEGAGVMVVVVSSFLLQAVSASAATKDAKTMDVFMISPRI